MADVTNYTIENASGANVRTDLNNVFAAIQSSNSKSSDLAASQCVAGMHFLNTTSKILKIRNSTNGGFTEIGNIDQDNLGLLSKAGGTMTGAFLADDSGTASAPAISFDGDTDLGLFRKSANIMGFSSSGTEQITFDGNGITLNAQNEVRFGDSDSSNYVGIKAPSTVSSSNKTITLPDETGTLLTSASSIANSNLANSSVTVGSTAINLGASATTIAGLTTLTSTNLQATNLKDTSGSNSSTTEQIAQGRAKAWINFNGTGTISIRDSFNVSSITDNGTGITTVTLTNAMSNDDYSVAGISGATSTDALRTIGLFNSLTTTTFKVLTLFLDATARDDEIVCCSVFGDQ
tara:strand:+ start:13 stop:1059 length:1047 start_codon:yes stop_codon:yes gene_type:complete